MERMTTPKFKRNVFCNSGEKRVAKDRKNHMIEDWLKYEEKKDIDYVFRLIHITENQSPPDDNLLKYLQEKILISYRKIDFYKFVLQNESKEKIINYIKEQVIPNNDTIIDKNVRQGDWGEVLTSLIILKFKGYESANKLQWKFNKNKSVFGTDLIAFNPNGAIHYFEIKTTQNPHRKKEGKYISVRAYNSLLNDMVAPTESIADFFMRLAYDKGEFEKAKKLKDIVLNPTNYKKEFELFFIVEKSKFIENILKELNNLPPELNPLNVTIVLIDNLGDLVNKTWQDIENVLIEKFNNE